MSLTDWNGDGKKDLQDDFIDYEIFNDDEDSEEEEYRSTRNSGEGCSNLEAAFYVIGGLILFAVFLTLFGLDVSEIPALLIFFLWLLFTAILVFIVMAIRNHG